MKVSDLIELLEEVEDKDSEVRLATQPSYPLQGLIAGVAVPAEDDPGMEEERAEENSIVWICDGGQPMDTPYASRRMWEIARSL